MFFGLTKGPFKEKNNSRFLVAAENEAMISCCIESGDWEQSFLLLEKLCSSRLSPDSIALTSVMSACGKANNWQRALRLFALQADAKIRLDVLHFNSVMKICEVAQQWQQVLQFFGDTFVMSIQPDQLTFRSLDLQFLISVSLDFFGEVKINQIQIYLNIFDLV